MLKQQGVAHGKMEITRRVSRTHYLSTEGIFKILQTDNANIFEISITLIFSVCFRIEKQLFRVKRKENTARVILRTISEQYSQSLRSDGRVTKYSIVFNYQNEVKHGLKSLIIRPISRNQHQDLKCCKESLKFERSLHGHKQKTSKIRRVKVPMK